MGGGGRYPPPEIGWGTDPGKELGKAGTCPPRRRGHTGAASECQRLRVAAGSGARLRRGQCVQHDVDGVKVARRGLLAGPPRVEPKAGHGVGQTIIMYEAQQTRSWPEPRSHSIDGTGNSAGDRGRVGDRLRRTAAAGYADGISKPVGSDTPTAAAASVAASGEVAVGQTDDGSVAAHPPSPRAISNALFDQGHTLMPDPSTSGYWPSPAPAVIPLIHIGSCPSKFGAAYCAERCRSTHGQSLRSATMFTGTSARSSTIVAKNGGARPAKYTKASAG